jgi:hypothetical protein
MICDETKLQLAALQIDPNRPLVISDVDEVIVHFTRDLEDFLATKNLWLNPASLALSGNIQHRETKEIISMHGVSDLIDAFFAERTRHMKPIDGAIEALQDFSKHANVVMLTNLPHFAGDDRRLNMADLGLNFTVITNSGPKGPALQNLAARTTNPVVFIDDSPMFIQSANEYVPHMNLVHFVQDERFAVHMPHHDYVDLRTPTWAEARPHILDIIR